tara:strand:- start:1529 stop:3400 length:1872 start_codon:yes stop_codon:yes gene_type:complete
MAEKVVLDVEIKTSGSQRTLGQLEEQAEQLNEELRKVPLGTKAFKDLQNQLIGVNKQVKNTELAMESLDNEQVASELGSVAGAVGDMTGAFILLGGSGGALEETAQNIEKALGVSMAFKGAIEGLASGRKLFNNIVKQSNILQKANNTITVIASVIMKTFTGSVDTTSKSFKNLRGAIISTGIGALVVAVGLLIANFDKLKEAINGVSRAQKDALDDQQKAVDLADERLNSISEQENILKLQGKSEREILNMKIKQSELAIETRKEYLKQQRDILKAEVRSEKRNARYLENFIKTIFIIPRTILKGVDLIGEGLNKLFQEVQKLPFAKKILGEEPINIDFGLDEMAEKGIESVAGLIFNPEETSEKAKETLKELEKGIKEVENQQAGFRLTLKAGDDKATEELNKTQDADKKRRSEMQRVQIKGNEETKLELVEQEKTFNQKMLELYGEDYLNYLSEVEKKKQEQLDFQNATFDLATAGVGALLELNDAFTGETEAQQKKAFERRKKLEIAGALISSAQGVVNIWANKSAVPSPFDIPFKIAQTGILLATTVAQISKIKQQQFSGGGSVSTPNIGGGGIPTIDPVTNTSTIVGQQSQQVYVTETDITNTQNQVSVIEDQATIQ